MGLSGAAAVAGAMALAQAGAAIARTPEGFRDPAIVLAMVSRIFLGCFAVGAPLALLGAAAVQLCAPASAERAFAVVVALLLALAAVLDQAFALHPETLEPEPFGWRSALLGVLASIGIGALLARAARGGRGPWLARAAAIFLPLGVLSLALYTRSRHRLPEAASPGVVIAGLALSGLAFSAGLSALLGRLSGGARRVFGALLALASGAMLAAPFVRDGGAAPPPADPLPAAARPKGPNVILISIDTLRADRLSCYGNPRRTSPAIDAVAAQGVRFEHAFSTSSWTLPSHASMLTGLHPASHGADRARPQSESRKIDALSPRVPTLAEEMRRRGYLTAAFVSNAFTSSAFGLQRGFAEFHDRFDRGDPLLALKDSLYWRAMLRLGFFHPNDFDAERRVDEILPEQIRWIERHASDPFFLFLHYMEPHYLYEPPEQHRRRPDGSAIPIFRELDPVLEGRVALPEDRIADLDALYDGEVAFLDAHLARFFAALDRAGLREKTLLIITADHGESLGEHGLWTHGSSLFEEQIRVPLIMRLPGVIPAGVVIESGLASHVDLMPTILELTGEGEPGENALQGESLRPLWDASDGRASEAHRTVYAELRSDLTWRRLNPAMGRASSMVRTATAKFVLEEPDHRFLFLIGEDPGETKNALASHPELARQLELALQAWKERTPPAGEPAGSSLDAGTLEQLRKLGYLR